LRHLAQATGGTYIYYDKASQYNSTLLYDTLWQVFTKKPQSINVSANGDTNKHVLQVPGNAPTILDLSRNGVVADSYRWDFDDNGTWDETSQGPVIEHQFTVPQQGLLHVQALDATGNVISESRQVYAISDNQPEEALPLSLPQNLAASALGDGTTKVTWSPEESHTLVAFDPVTKLPIGSAPMSEGSLVVPSLYDNIVVRVISDNAASDPVTIPVTPYVLPPLETGTDETPPDPETEQPVLQPAEEMPPTTEATQLPLKDVTHQDPVSTTQPSTSTVTVQTPGVVTPAQEAARAAIVSAPQVAGIATENIAKLPSTDIAPQYSPRHKTNKLWLVLLLLLLIFLTFKTYRRITPSSKA
jgi:hypothetical protein